MIEHRPIAHLRPATGWTNDPVGPVRWRGRTHLFHQANPDGGYWDRPSWGHFVSDDLVHWEQRQLALSPDDDGPDADGCFSGCIVDDDGVAVMLYTGARGPDGPDQEQTTCIARSHDDGLDQWVKDPGNPVTTPPDGLELTGFRDPFVWKQDGRWQQLVGAGIVGEGGAVLRFSSPDLVTWTDEGVVLTGAQLDAAAVAGADWTGSMWECPALLRTPSADVLLVNIHDDTTHYPVAVIGSYTAGRFEPRRLQRFDLGPDLYAPCLLVEPSGRAVVWGWSWEAVPAARQRDAGWAGVLSLPRTLDVVDDRLAVTPLPELDMLRVHERRIERVPTPAGWWAAGAEGDSVDLVATIAVDAGRVELRVRCSPDRAEATSVGIDLDAGRVWLDREQSSLDPHAADGRYEGAVEVATGDPVELRVVIDRSIIEVFVANRVALTARVYPTRADSVGVEVVGARIGPDHVGLQAYQLGSVWKPHAAATPGTPAP